MSNDHVHPIFKQILEAVIPDEDEKERDEPPEDGECFRGNEAAAYEAEQQAWIQREFK